MAGSISEGLISAMARIGLISCVSKKRLFASKARDLYDSALFAKSRQFVELYCDKWFILSAKYGLLQPDDIIEPYEETLNKKSSTQRKEWASKVWQDLRPCIEPKDKITILAGEKYREHLIPFLRDYGSQVDIPMLGLGIGRQLQWLSQKLKQQHRARDVERFYSLLLKLEFGLGGKRLLRECNAHQVWPKRGVYFFFEPGEKRLRSGYPRIVRVGTHGVSRGSKATLWNRLRTHRGTMNGLGNHRGSIFRLHVGAAIANRDSIISIPTWGIGQTAAAEVREAEIPLEQMVSSYIGNMNVLWLAIGDDASPSSDRAFIERNVIGLLVGKKGPVDPPSREWLGLYSPEQRICQSGLWNLDFLNYTYDPISLDILEEYVDITIGARPAFCGSIAPMNWYSRERLKIPRNQLMLFEE